MSSKSYTQETHYYNRKYHIRENYTRKLNEKIDIVPLVLTSIFLKNKCERASVSLAYFDVDIYLHSELIGTGSPKPFIPSLA